jgi:hypothetical protein
MLKGWVRYTTGFHAELHLFNNNLIPVRMPYPCRRALNRINYNAAIRNKLIISIRLPV